MSRILLADHSPHAQRMGERILRDEGFEVVTVTDGETALLRLKDLAPDLVLADVSLPSRSGYEICEYVKTSGKYPQTRVLLTAGPVAAFDDTRAHAAGSDGFVRKPFEASVLLAMVQPLMEKPDSNAIAARATEFKPAAPMPTYTPAPAAPQPAAQKPIDREQVRAAVILALDASLITMIENITDKVVVALEAEARTAVPSPAKAAETRAAAAPAQPARLEQPKSQPAPAPEEPVVRIRTPVFRTLS
jgi:CheY-like chemotaxis protein